MGWTELSIRYTDKNIFADGFSKIFLQDVCCFRHPINSVKALTIKLFNLINGLTWL